MIPYMQRLFSWATLASNWTKQLNKDCRYRFPTATFHTNFKLSPSLTTNYNAKSPLCAKNQLLLGALASN